MKLCRNVKVFESWYYTTQIHVILFLPLFYFFLLFQSKSPGGEIKATITDLVNKPLNFPVSI